ncbi:MAG: potassium channel family protein [Cyanobacteriota bacterium]|nr:potassium channel family protein [Cyanobacteriota bacterium]
MQRSTFYGRLLATCIALMVCFGLPVPWSRLASIGYLLLGLVLIVGWGREPAEAGPRLGPFLAYRLLGLAAIAFWLLWVLTPLQMRNTGIPVILLWTLFGGWSAMRLIQRLAREQRVTGAVLQGALAGYLMLGLASGLLLSGLETIDPGSFRGIDLASQTSGAHPSVWGLNFVQLNYFAFVSLTTMGYGDVIPLTPAASMICVMIAIAGTFYIAAVMGVLISRLTVQEAEESRR